jgi:type II secretory pathway pseudopilin PulG
MHEPEEKPANSSKRPRSRTLGRIVLEVFSIVLGVLLALGVSEWQEQRDNEARAATALANVRAELQSNLDLLNIIYPINSRIVDRLSSGRENDSDDESLVPGVQLRSSAWQTLGSTGLSNYVDYKLLIGLSQLYSMIDVYRQSAFSFISSNMDMAATATALGSNIDNDLYSKNFLPYFQLLVQIESALIDVHQKAIESIDLQQSHVKQ